MKHIYFRILLGIFLSLLFYNNAFPQITANNSAGQTTTAYTNSATNVPIHVWCATSANPTPASLTANPTVAGTYTFQWYKHNPANFQWAAYSSSTGTNSTINNLSNGGYKVEVKNGATIVECFHAWVWNFIGNSTITKTGNCSSLSLGAGITANDTFTYYNPPAPPSLINSSTQITVCFTATHTWVSDLGFYLVGPVSCGSPTIPLSPNPGSIGQNSTCNNGMNVNNLCFSTTSSANFNMCTAITPLTGTYGTYGATSTAINWAPLVGCDAAQGGWKVQIYDCVAADVGTLTNASITFANLTSVCGSPTTITHASGTINSAINDNSCSSATASTFSVPSPFSLPIKLAAARAILWNSTTPGVSFSNTTTQNTTATVPLGNDTIGVSITYTIGSAQCTIIDTISHINPTPAASALPTSAAICSGDTTNIVLSSSTPGTTYSWTVVQTGVTGASAGSGNFIKQLLTVTGATQGTVIYTITPTNGGCVGATIFDTVFVKPLPNISSTPTKQLLCSGNTTNFLLSSNVAGTAFTWSVVQNGVSGASAAGGSSIVQTLSNTTTIPGSAVYTITALANGCAGNTIIDTAIVNPTFSTIDSRSICQGQSYTFNSIIYTTGNNTAKDTFQTINGCDSIITLNLTVTPYLTGSRVVNICQGQSYIFNGITYTSNNNTAKDTVSSTTTCDSIITLNLTVTPYLTGTRVVNICQGQSYTFNGITYTTNNNTAKDTVSSATTCDSIITLNLTVAPYLTGTRVVNICQGQSYTFNGITYTTNNNTAKDTVSSATTCDSIITLNLTVTPYLTGTRMVNICQGQSYTFNGITYTTNNNTAKDTVSSTTTCDSIITLNLTVAPYLTGTRVVNICQGQSYTFNGITYTSNNNTAKDTVSSTTTCDSIITLNLTVTPYLTGTRMVNICQGQSYTFNGITYTTNNNTAKDTVSSATTCDSIITLNLTFTPYLTGTRVVNICQGQSYTFNGTTYTSNNNTAKDTVSSTITCDSIITLNLTVTPYLTGVQFAIICNGQSYTFNGITYTTSNNTAKDTLTTAAGCDSIVTLNLTVGVYLNGTRTVTICTGQSYTFNGITYTSSNNTAKDTIQNAAGCDSLISLNLTVLPILTGVEKKTICFGQTYTFNGVAYSTNNNTAKDSFISVKGCDSIVTLNLTVLPPPSSITIDTISCGPIIFNGITYNTSTTLQDTLYTSLGCDSLYRNIIIVVNPVYGFLQSIDTTACDSLIFEGKTYYQDTVLLQTFKTILGCDSLQRTVNINVDDFSIDLSASTLQPYIGELITLTTTSNQQNYQVQSWTPMSLFANQDGKSQYTYLYGNTIITVMAVSNDGCSDSASLSFNVLGLDYTVLFPTAFSPNGDGRNDVFRPLLNIQRGYKVKYFRILNRWGFEVFHQISQLLQGWDGTYQGEPQDTGVYFYYFEIEFSDGHKIQMKGDVTLIK